MIQTCTETDTVAPEEHLSYPEFMKAMSHAPWDYHSCKECGGTGLRPITCCSGHHCGCYGQPVDYGSCSCDNPTPTDAQLRQWLKNATETETNDRDLEDGGHCPT